ncbi:gene transfer agent family protein [Bosea sp. SSUT16]|uniref:Gene transfer agent family protein n=1 Tax=Bosea spartocytisi TaxID=2773451 RepID=A0A927I0A6_9HYPH|nr:gene transfer agent family protein [Bosea spartocytisi]MBD3847109.1 gene transfer agent family protein [Bosea spartocytisi]MCT4474195.1 gene transfer agent family protein [Bosea spartocytisi]
MIGDIDQLDGSVVLPFGEEERLFRLGMDQLFALEQKRDCGFALLHDRLMRGGWSIADVSETLRLGLVGAGMELRPAKELVDRYCVPGRLEACATLAFYVLAVVMDAPKALAILGKGGATVDTTEATDAFPSSPSTDSPPSPESTRARSGASPSGDTSRSSRAGTRRTKAPTRRQNP